MNRRQLEHVLRAAARITGDPDVLVLGSQSILGAVLDDRLPLEATVSMEVDITFFHDPDDIKSDQVDGAIGELSCVPRDLWLLCPRSRHHHGDIAARLAVPSCRPGFGRYGARSWSLSGPT